MLVLEGIAKDVNRKPHLHPIDLTIEKGSFNVVVGRTRAGKTSLLRIIAGLDSPTAGTLRMDGANLAKIPLRKRKVAMVYQAFINYPSLTVYDNIASPMRRQKLARDRVDERVRELAQMLHIEPLLERLPGHISGGQQQRVAIARALAKGADLLLLDEPLVNLDYKLREELRDELRNILAKTTTTVLYTTSEPSEAMAFGGNTIVMHEGRVAQSAPALEAYHRPASITAARVLSDPPMSFFAISLADGRARLLADGEGDAELAVAEASGASALPDHIAELPDGTYRVGIRASDCTLKPPSRPHIELPGEVELVEISGSETFVHLRARGGHFIVREQGVYPHDLGHKLTIFLDPDRLLLFDDADDGALRASYMSASQNPG